MTFDPHKAALALNRLFSTCPLPAANATPEEAVRVFFEVCQPFTTGQILDAVDDFINGRVPGINPAFAPTAPQFATHMRLTQKREHDLRSGNIRLLEQLREREEDEEWAAQRTPEARAKVKSMLDAIAEKDKTRTPEEIAQAKATLAKHDALYADQFVESPAGVKVSTHLVEKLRSAGYTTFNAADDDRHDMGQME